MQEEVKVYTLKRPVTSGEYTCEELRFKRPTTKDFLAVGSNEMDTMEAMAAYISSNTGVPRIVVDKIDIDDLATLRIEVGRVFSSYFLAKPYELNPTPEAGGATENASP
jgi:hypothetical protein